MAPTDEGDLNTLAPCHLTRDELAAALWRLAHREACA